MCYDTKPNWIEALWFSVFPLGILLVCMVFSSLMVIISTKKEKWKWWWWRYWNIHAMVTFLRTNITEMFKKIVFRKNYFLFRWDVFSPWDQMCSDAVNPAWHFSGLGYKRNKKCTSTRKTRKIWSVNAKVPEIINTMVFKLSF